MNAMNAALEALWPARLDTGPATYEDIRERFDRLLRQAGVEPVAFSHVGIVVADVVQGLKQAADALGKAWLEAEPVWGEAFGCTIARRVEDGIEYELIQPEREGFLKRHLEEHGPGVQHLSFTVPDLGRALSDLLAAGAKMAVPGTWGGLHGSIAFVRPPEFAPLCLELCESAVPACGHKGVGDQGECR